MSFYELVDLAEHSPFIKKNGLDAERFVRFALLLDKYIYAAPTQYSTKGTGVQAPRIRLGYGSVAPAKLCREQTEEVSHEKPRQ